MKIDLRVLEKTDKFGFIFYISYDGEKFHSFDEMSGKISVKSKFREIIEGLGFTWAKGIQQAGRTDAKVSASENLLYMSSYYTGDLESLKEQFNKNSQSIKIKKILKTLPNLVFPDLVEQREYLYRYPKKMIKRESSEIIKLCKEKSGRYDVSEFTDKKGLELKEHIRTVNVTYEECGKDGILRFLGDSFMPKQVRIMSSYILTDSYDPLPGKYLTLSKIYLKTELQELFITEVKTPFIEESEESISHLNSIEEYKNFDFSKLKIEKIGDKITIFYLPKERKSEFIGKNGNNIKKLKKILGNILVREVLN